MAGHAGPAFSAKVLILLATTTSAVPLTFQESLLRNLSHNAVVRKGVKPPAQANEKVAVGVSASGGLQVVPDAHVAEQGSATVSSGSQASSRAALILDNAKITGHVSVTAHSSTSSSQFQSATSLSTAVKGGLAGMLAGIVQVICLLWVRTIMNHQYYYGGGFFDTARNLNKEGGLARFYQGLSFAIFQVPLARFGDTFAQSAVIALFSFHAGQKVHGVAAGFIVASISACWRFIIAPLDTLKLTAQVHGASAGKLMGRRLQEGGVTELWSGSLALFAVIWVASFPFWTVYNAVLQYWPAPHTATMHMLRNGLAGVLGSLASDIASNGLRVLKVKRQAAEEGSVSIEGYLKDARDVIAKDGLYGMLFRGITTKLVAGAVQGAFFSVLWNLLRGQ